MARANNLDDLISQLEQSISDDEADTFISFHQRFRQLAAHIDNAGAPLSEFSKLQKLTGACSAYPYIMEAIKDYNNTNPLIVNQNIAGAAAFITQRLNNKPAGGTTQSQGYWTNPATPPTNPEGKRQPPTAGKQRLTRQRFAARQRKRRRGRGSRPNTGLLLLLPTRHQQLPSGLHQRLFLLSVNDTGRNYGTNSKRTTIHNGTAHGTQRNRRARRHSKRKSMRRRGYCPKQTFIMSFTNK